LDATHLKIKTVEEEMKNEKRERNENEQRKNEEKKREEPAVLYSQEER
jgi:hypothetical protein